MFKERLQNARKSSGLSLRELAEKVHISHAAIKKYEDGKSMPSSDILLRLSKALKVRTEYFFRPKTIFLEGINYRKHGKLSKKEESSITHEIIEEIERRIELENLFPHPPIKTFTMIDELPSKINNRDQIEELADIIRNKWDLGFGPIPDLIDLLEEQGIRVFCISENHKDFDKKFDGLMGNIKNSNEIIIVVSNNWPGDRQRFTLAHEFGHLILKDRLANSIDEEEACNHFSGAFLFPQASVFQALGNHRNAIEPKELALLKEEFGISMAGILHRAKDLKIISQKYYMEMVKDFHHKGWDKKEPTNSFPSQKAHIFKQLIFRALAEEYIGESKAAELMNISLSEFLKLRAMKDTHAVTDQRC